MKSQQSHGLQPSERNNILDEKKKSRGNCVEMGEWMELGYFSFEKAFLKNCHLHHSPLPLP